MYQLLYTSLAQKDAKKIKESNLKTKCEELLKIIEKNPYQVSPPYKKLVGELRGYISRRIDIKHRLIYKVYEEKKVVKVIRLWTHYSE
jgi:Txe/YoeB family toxin of toxin-antitoxin system